MKPKMGNSERLPAHGIMATTQKLIDVLQAKSASSWWHLTTILVVLYLFCAYVWSHEFTCDLLSATTVNQLQFPGEWSFSRNKLPSMPVYGVNSGWNYLYNWCLHKSVVYFIDMLAMCIGIFIFFTTGLLFHNKVAKCYQMCNVCIACCYDRNRKCE